jgi:AmmeMemoRadiSam system protein B
MMRPSRSNTSVRPPAVAGFFYPDDPVELRDTVSGLIERAASSAASIAPAMLTYIVPHAGYMYSGGVAATAYAHMKHAAVKPRRVVIIGPSHRAYLQGIAICEAGAFSTPLGEIPVDAQAKRALLKRGDVVFSDVPHAQEHSLEVQLPFLQALFGDFEIVPLVVGSAEPEYVAAVLDAVANDPETLLLASSDLSHYLTYEEARRVDAETHTRILGFTNTLSGEQACGAVALNGLLTLAKERRASIAPLSLMNSGDTAGDRSRVVGYAAYAIDDHRSARPQ